MDNTRNVTKSITFPDRLQVIQLTNISTGHQSEHYRLSSRVADEALAGVEEVEVKNFGGGCTVSNEEEAQNAASRSVQNHLSEPLISQRPNDVKDGANHMVTLTEEARTFTSQLRCPDTTCTITADEASDNYPFEGNSIIKKIRGILQQNVTNGLWNPLTMDHHSLFTQLNILCHFQDGSIAWKETARWLKYEEKVEMGGRWSKPHVSTSSLHALLELRKAVKTKQCVVDLHVDNKSSSLSDFADSICGSILNSLDLGETTAGNIKHILLQPHKHKHTKASRKNRRDEGGIRSAPVYQGNFTRRKSLVKREGKDYWSAYTSFQHGIQPCDLKPYKPNKKLMSKIPNSTETANILIGQVDFLEQPIMGIFRLKTSSVIEGLSEVSLPTRFFLLVIGPFSSMSLAEYCELGRAFAALFNDKVFCEVCYQATAREEVLYGIDEYLDGLTVLPPSIWDPCTRLEPPSKARTKSMIWSRLNDADRYAEFQDNIIGGHDDDDQSLTRTGRLFGGLLCDIRRKFKFYASDFKDGFHVQCIASVVFLYFACITPIVTFGGLMGRKTENYMGTMEMLMSAAICGTLYALFAGQPLNIVGATGPLLVFESIVFHLCKEYSIDFLSFRFWIGLWSFLYLMVIVAFDLSSFVRYITRFTEESFAVLISLIFVFEAFSKILEIWDTHPVLLNAGQYAFEEHQNSTQNFQGCFCLPANDLLLFQETSFDSYRPIESQFELEARLVNIGNAAGGVSQTADSIGSLSDSINIKKLPEDCITYRGRIVVSMRCISKKSCLNIRWNVTGLNCEDNYIQSVPDVFLLSCLLFFGTFWCAFTLRHFRNSPFFPSMIRNLLGDFAVLLSITIMTMTDYFFGLDTPKLEVPSQIKPTFPNRDWVVNPMKVGSWWLILVATFPGLLATILVSLDQLITSVIINRKENKLKKGHGYHLDVFVLALLIVVCSFLGLPWFVAATVRAITHVKSLIKESSVRMPGDKPQMLGVREQRLTGLCIHLLIGFSSLLTSVLQLVPMPVLYGVFLYMGITSLSDVQFVERVLILFMPIKYQPDYIYLRHVKTANVHIFTIIQVACSAFMWVVKSVKITSIGFPLMLIALIATRKAMDVILSQRDLYWLDNLLPDAKRRKFEDFRKIIEKTADDDDNIKDQEENQVWSDDEDAEVPFKDVPMKEFT